MKDEERRLSEAVRRRHGVATAAELMAEKFSRHAIDWALRRGRLVTVRRGVYAWADRWQRAEPEQRHIWQVLAQQRVHPALVASSVSAAIVLGLPTPTGPPDAPQLTAARAPRPMGAPRQGGRGRRGGAVTRRARLGPDEIWTLRNGIRVTSPTRTVLDCTRSWSRLWGLAIADAAIFKALTTPAQLTATAADRPGVKGARRCLWVAEHARELVESPLESLARGLIVLGGFPEPTPQVWLRTRLGSYRVDLLDKRHRLITEADGRIKYLRGQDVVEEKRREDALRELDLGMMRFGIDDFRAPRPWLQAYRRALARSEHRLLR